ncbi:ATP-dependent nuclease [Sorangium sp. So ce854]|uniref:ATP-dependent nuclease n=1 Tax=Sorangium sp. So ce854 TaxID=3133322 RepID=UPI003F62843B
MLRRIQLRSFRGFRSLDVSCGPVTGIIGKNSSGKTSILHAVRMVGEAFAIALADETIRPQANPTTGVIEVCTQEVVLEPARLIPLADWRQIFTDAAVGEGVSLSVDLMFEPDDALQAAHLELRYGRNAQLKMTLHAQSRDVALAVADLPKKSVHRPRKLREELLSAAPRTVFVPAFYGVTRVEEYRTQPLVDRLLGSGDQSHIVRNLVARLDGGALARMNAFLSRALGAQVVRRTAQQDAESRPDLEVVYQDTNGDLELSSAGAGLIGLVALYAALERIREERARSENRPIVFLLDEPEAHLHPRLQGDVGEALAKLAGEFGVQLLLATHSVEMVNRFGRQPETVLLSVDRATSTAVTLQSESDVLRALDDFCDLSPFTSLSFLASRRILFYEGPSDWRVLEACARVYFRSDPARLRQFERYTPVPLEGVGNAVAPQVLRKVLTPELFPKIDAQHPVRAALALDRDYTREPKPAQATDLAPHFKLIEAIWSRNCIESLFLEPPCLAAWLASYVGLDPAALQQLVAHAIEDANADRTLEDVAYEGRYPFHRRPDAHERIATEKNANKVTRGEIRGDPATWQPGKRRAAFILERVRAALPKDERRRLRGNLVDVIAGAAASSTADPTVLVPAEIRAFLDLLVAPRKVFKVPARGASPDSTRMVPGRRH